MLLSGLIAVNVAVVRSRRKNPNLDRPFEVPAVPYVPIVAVLANLVLLVNVEPKSFALGLFAEGVGVAFWFLWMSRGPPAEELERETPTVVAERTPTEQEYTVVVPIANPDHAAQLTRTASDLASEHDGEVIVVSVVTLPDQTPLSEGREYVDERREILRRAMDVAESRDVPVSGTIRIGHHAGVAILNTVRQHEADAVLIGWSGRPSRRREVVLGSVVDMVVTEAPCDVYVERIGEVEGDVDSILVPTAGGPHLIAAANLARAVAIANDASVELMHVLPPDADASRRADGEEALARGVDLLEGTDVSRVTVEDADVVESIVDRSDRHDLTVVGATQEGILEQLVFGAVPEAVGRRAHGTVVMAKRRLDVRARIRYLAYRLRPR